MATIHYLFEDDCAAGRDQPLDLLPYPTDDEIESGAQPAPAAFDGFRTGERRFTRLAILVAGALLSWMLYGIIIAKLTGRL